LLFSGEKLAFVPGIGVDCEYQANKDEPGVVVKFEELM
jgi:tRNA(Ile)-lysidine synthase